MDGSCLGSCGCRCCQCCWNRGVESAVLGEEVRRASNKLLGEVMVVVMLVVVRQERRIGDISTTPEVYQRLLVLQRGNKNSNNNEHKHDSKPGTMAEVSG